MGLIQQGVDIPFTRNPTGARLISLRNHPNTKENKPEMAATILEMLKEGYLVPFDTKGGTTLPKAVFASRAVVKAGTNRVRVTPTPSEEDLNGPCY